MKVAELFAYLGVIADEKKAKDFFHVLEGGKNILFGLATMAVGSSVAIGVMLDKSLQGALALSHFEAQTGLSAQRLQEWQHVGESLGLTADSVTNSIANLNAKLEMAKRTGESAGPFSILGNIFEIKDAWDVLDRLKKLVQSGQIPRQTMLSLVRQMGLGGEMIKALELSTDQFNKSANRAAIVTKDQINRALAYNASLKKLGQTITYLFAKSFAELAPAAIEMVDSALGWINENRDDIEKAIVGITKVLGVFVIEFGRAFTGIDDIVKRMMGWENAFKGLAGVAIALNPLARVLFVIAELLRVIDYFMSKEGSAMDKWNKFRRGESGGVLGWAAGHVTRAGEKT
ncbi:MAG: hypothetical protein KAV87_19765, partial [Desulfobacteraceae bacterium]|nr:hypothetical protein [Desulfobacteraceae bacterium]